jgi:hypothetical protein
MVAVKIMHQLKAVLSLVLVIGGVVQGSSCGDNDPPLDSSNFPSNERNVGENPDADLPSNGGNAVGAAWVPPDSEEAPPGPEERQIYIIGNTDDNRFVIVDNNGNPVYPSRRFDAFRRMAYARNCKCIILPLALFWKVASEANCRFMRNRYPRDRPVGYDIYRRIRHEKRILSYASSGSRPILNGIGVIANHQRYSVIRLSDGNFSLAMDARTGEFFRVSPNMETVYGITVSGRLFEILTQNPIFIDVPTTRNKIITVVTSLGIGLIWRFLLPGPIGSVIVP